MKTYTYQGTQVTLKKTTYRNNGTLALILNELDGDVFAVVTVNLNHPLQSDDMAFLDENNYPGIGKWIEKNHLGRQMGFVAASGFCKYRLYSVYLIEKGELQMGLSFLFFVNRAYR